MLLQTKHFGEVEIDETKILTFEEGIPSFEKVKKYILLISGEGESPFKWLQSIDDANLAFAVANPFLIKADYDVELSDEIVNALNIEKDEDVEIYSILVVPSDISKMSMNLKAPIVINVKHKKGRQVVLDTDKYGVRHYVLDELRRQEVKQNAGSNKEEGTIHSNK